MKKPTSVGFYWLKEKETKGEDFKPWTIVEVYNKTNAYGCYYELRFSNLAVAFMDGRYLDFENVKGEWGDKIIGKCWDERLQEMKQAKKDHKASWANSDYAGGFY